MTERQLPDELDAMAAGLALGLLDGSERADALRRQLEDPAFAERVRAWFQVADRWLEEIEPVRAPGGVLASLEAKLDRRALEKVPNMTANDRVPARVWRTWAITATAASSVLAIGLGLSVFAPNQDPGNNSLAVRDVSSQSVNVAQIDDAEGVPLLSALYHPNSGTLSLRIADLQQPAYGPELWIIPQDGVPRSLGLLDSDRLTVTLSPELRSYLQDGATMAITIEPRDGAPHDAPTGDILGTAVLQELQQGNI